MPSSHLQISEIFHSIQGESTRAGLPCVFIRLRGCHLRCTYCDTEYAFRDGTRIDIDDIIREASSYPTRLAEITGGEPLLQTPVHELIERLCDDGWTVMIETSGACDISVCDPRAVRILDLKTPGSGESDANLLANLDHLTDRDEIKFVITDRADFDWATDMIREHRLDMRAHAVLFSPVFEQTAGDEIRGCAGLDPATLAQWMLDEGTPGRMQIQMHKSIWHPQARGV